MQYIIVWLDPVRVRINCLEMRFLIKIYRKNISPHRFQYRIRVPGNTTHNTGQAVARFNKTILTTVFTKTA